MAETKIEWANFTFNGWIGCQKVSPGCDNCYAEALMDKRYHKVEWGPHGERKRTSVANWKLPLRWNRQAKERGIRYRVFSASLSDWLDNQVPAQWRMDLAHLIEATPHLDWLLLTKRIENYAKLTPWDEPTYPIPSNVWLGVTAEDQEHFDKRWGILSTIKATVRFISYEPALGPITPWADRARPDWVIMGGESGHGARHMPVEWARWTRDACSLNFIKFFFKQMSGRTPIPDDLMIRQFPNAKI